MTIAFVSDAIYPYHKGGKEKRLYEVTTRLAALGHEIHIYTMQWWEGPKDVIENGVHLHAICKFHPLYDGERRSIKEGLIYGLTCFKLITKKFDVVDVDHMPFFPLYSVWLVCKLRDKKLIGSWNEVWGRKYWTEYMGVAGNIAYLIERISVILPDFFTSISPHTTEALAKTLHCKKPIVTIPVGIDVQRIAKVSPAKKSYDVMFAGRLLKNKRIDLLIQAIAKLNDKKVRCLIIGEGPERKKLEKLASRLSVQKQVIFHDFYEDHDGVIAAMKSAKLFASPSEREGFGIVAIEAMACGTPVITNLAPANATKDLVKHGKNGFVFEQTTEAMAEVLKEALQTAESLNAICLRHARKFDWNKITALLSEVYTS